MEARSAIRARGADLLVVMPIDAARADEWRRRHGARDVLVAGDPERALYRALGVGRGSARALLLDPASWRDGLREAARLRPAWKARGDDGFQLGADLLLGRDGEVRFIHRARSAADRVPVDELLARL
ncbi:MAG: AhpC/TSA antioxidant enzyme [Actinomycetota bacterium]